MHVYTSGTLEGTCRCVQVCTQDGGRMSFFITVQTSVSVCLCWRTHEHVYISGTLEGTCRCVRLCTLTGRRAHVVLHFSTEKFISVFVLDHTRTCTHYGTRGDVQVCTHDGACMPFFICVFHQFVTKSCSVFVLEDTRTCEHIGDARGDV